MLGAPAAYILKRDVYSYAGEHLAGFSSGYLRDHAGYAVGSVSGALGGTLLPIPSIPPIPPIPGMLPIPGIPSIPPIPALGALGWSEIEFRDLFSV